MEAASAAEGPEHKSSEHWSNEQWLDALRAGGVLAALAEAALIRLLRAGLQRALAAKPEALPWIDDFAQESAMRILSQLDRFRADSRFTTWAMAIAIRVAFDEMRRKRWRDVSLDAVTESGATQTPSTDPDPERQLAKAQMLASLDSALNDLTTRQRTALVAELRGMPQTEITRHLGTNRNALYKLTHDARKQLKGALQQRGITLETIDWVFEPQ